MNSGLDDLLSEFLLSQPIRLYDFSEDFSSLEDYEEIIQVKDLENPEDITKFAINLYQDDKSFLVYDKGEYYELLELKDTMSKLKFFDITELCEFYIRISDLDSLSVTLKRKSLKKFLKIKLNYIYHLRSGYYHTGKSFVSEKTHFMFHGPWKGSDGTEYSPLVSHRLVPLLSKLAPKVIISAWEQKANSS